MSLTDSSEGLWGLFHVWRICVNRLQTERAPCHHDSTTGAMGLLRSEQMKHGTLVLPVDRARHFINLIGACTNMQFEDMNARDMHRPYKKYIQRIDEMERILRFVNDEFQRVPEAQQVITGNVDDFLTHA